jgi:hypothetical protein
MDEEDGRPGHVALKSGHLNAFNGVPAVPLCRAFSTQNFSAIRSEARRGPQRPDFGKPQKTRVALRPFSTADWVPHVLMLRYATPRIFPIQPSATLQFQGETP